MSLYKPRLNTDILADVFAFLRVSEILLCCRVCKRYREAATRRDKLWKCLCVRDGYGSYVHRHARRIAVFFDSVVSHSSVADDEEPLMADALGQGARSHKEQLSKTALVLEPFVLPFLEAELAEGPASLATFDGTHRRTESVPLPDGHEWYHFDKQDAPHAVPRTRPSNDMGAAIQGRLVNNAQLPPAVPFARSPLLELTPQSLGLIVEVISRAANFSRNVASSDEYTAGGPPPLIPSTACEFFHLYQRFTALALPKAEDADGVISTSLEDACALVRRSMTGTTAVCPHGVHPYWVASTGAPPPNPSWTPFRLMEYVWRTIEDFLITDAHIYLYCSLLPGGLSNRTLLNGLPFSPHMDAGVVAMYLCCGGQSVPGSIFTESLLVALSSSRETYQHALGVLGVVSLNMTPFVHSSRESSGIFGHYERAADAAVSLLSLHQSADLATATNNGELLLTFAATPLHPKAPQYSVALDEIPQVVPRGAVFYSGSTRTPFPGGATVVAPNIETFLFNFSTDLCQRRRFPVCPSSGLINRFPSFGFASAHLLTTTVTATAGIEITASATPVVLGLFQFMFVYRISMRLLPSSPYEQVKLLMRHWILRNEGGEVIDTVTGDAVVGDYPTLTRLTQEEYIPNVGHSLTEQERGGSAESPIPRGGTASAKEYVYCSRTVFTGSPNSTRVGPHGYFQQSWLMGGTLTFVAFTDGKPTVSMEEAHNTMTDRPDLARSHVRVTADIGDFMCRAGAFEDQLLYGELL